MTSRQEKPDNETLSYHSPPKVQTFGHYQLLEKLGQGGMGVVFAAFDTRLKRKVAIKFVREDLSANPNAKERFLREARNAAQIKHDHVVTMYETNEIEGVPFFTMEYLEGMSLEEYLEQNPTPTVPQILRIGSEIASGLAKAHQMGVVHRDIKPANLWLEAPHGRIKILDFGLAKLIDDEVNLSQQGVIVGTPAYMSPEQASHQSLDARSDLFSLGSVLYRLCSSRYPFAGKNISEVLRAIVNDPVVSIRELNSEIPVEFATLIHTLLEKNPDSRTQNAESVVDQIHTISKQIGASTDVANTFLQLESLHSNKPEQPQQVRETQRITGKSTLHQHTPERRGRFSQIIMGITFLVGLVLVGLLFLPKTEPPEQDTTQTDTPKDQPLDPIEEKKPSIKVPHPPVEVDPYRRAAEYVLAVGGHANIEINGRSVKLSTPLPPEKFTFKSINFSTNRKLKDSDLAVFEGCKKIASLQLDNTAISDDGLKVFSGIDSVTILSLRGTNSTTRGLSYFENSLALYELVLDSTKIDDQGFEVIVKFQKLFSLNLVNTAISDRSIPHLATLKKLRGMQLKGTAITEEGLATLRQMLPDCKVSK